MIVRVQPLVAARAVDRPFDYAVPADLEAAVEPGALVRVELGSRRVAGVVVEATERASSDGELKPLLAVTGRLPEGQLELALWLAAECASTLPRALALLTPPPSAGAEPVWVRWLSDAGASRRQAEVLAVLLSGSMPLADLLAAASTTRATVERMAARGLVALEREPRLAADPAGGPDLTDAQREAVEACLVALDSGGGDVLVHGVTGSGKTEVYLRVVAEALGRDRGAIVLVPEIALTPQTAARFVGRFGSTVAVLHSGLSPGRRGREHERIAGGAARVVVGARSAIFAAVPRLGVIVVDEEHDAAYKHESDPRYDARRVAAKRARQHAAVAVFGSATPRPEAWRGIARRASLPARIGGLLPAVEVVDLRRDGGYPFTRPLLDGLAALEDRGGRAILLQNRRGAASALHCRTCARSWRCPRCDVALTLHGQLLRCHHCGHRERVPHACPVCGSVDLAQVGAGTGRAEADLRARFPGLAVFRLDADVAAAAGEPERTLERFGSEPAAVLVGTQLVAKGHDVRGVELAAVLDADVALAVPDFRAEERAFALLTQLAGRPGRPGDRRGRVLIQTWDPQLRVVELAARHAVGEFLSGELERREALDYPPFRRLVRVLVAAPAADLAEQIAGVLAGAAAPVLEGDAVLGPAPLMRLRGRGRAHLLVKTTDARRAAATFRSLLRDLAADLRRAGATAVVDVDPQSLA